MKKLKRTGISTFFLCSMTLTLLAAGCTGTQSAPTHRWASSNAVDEAQYRNDHARCQSQANITGARQLDANSEAFAAYKQCMSTRGYELTAYRN